ncbi:MAG: hypothetical protein H0U51_09265, partial [Propionibacteriales bacterium]|nr:hypothetical protein [Propionibacteriales bacterium]
MMSSASTRKRAEEFAAAVDGRFVSVPDETRTFLALVEQLRDLDTPRPDRGFAVDLRARLVAAAQTELTSSPVDSPSTDRRSSRLEPRRRRIMSVAASVCIVAGSGVGAAAASQSALPGDALYPVKRVIERVELSIAGSSAERGQEYLESADTRLTEIQGLALTRPDDLETPALIGQALDEFSAQATAGADSLIRAYHRESSEQSIVDLREFTDESAAKLDVLGEAIPAEAHLELLAAAETLTSIDAAAREACPACSALAPLTLTGELAAFQREISNPAPAPGQPTTGSRPDPAPSQPTDRPAPGQHYQPSRPVGSKAPTQAPILQPPVLQPAPTAVPPLQRPTAGALPNLLPPVGAPPLQQPTLDAPTLLQPPTAGAPPVQQPTLDAPPVQQPTAGAPPAQQPTADAPPVQQPTADAPTLLQPPTAAAP